MNHEDIIKLARKAWFSEWAVRTPQDLERFAVLVAAKEREACAQIGDGYDYGCRNCGDEIRARSKQ